MLEFNTPTYNRDLATRVSDALYCGVHDDELTVWYKVTGYLNCESREGAKDILLKTYRGRWYNHRKDYYDYFTDGRVGGEDLVYVTFNDDETVTLTFEYEAGVKVEFPEDFYVYQESIEIRRTMP